MMRLYRPRVKAISIVTMAVLCAFAKSEEERQVAITVDDLLYANGRDCDPQKILSITEALLKPLREARVSVVGLVVGARCSNLTREQRAGLLQMWLDAGAELGNHTWSHPDLNKVELKEYERQILAEDEELRSTIPP